MNLSNAAKVTRVMNAVAAGTTDSNGSTVDMRGYGACQFIVAFGAITSGAVTSVKAQTSSDDSNWDDLEGTSITVADDDDNQVVVLDINNPRERYLRVVVDRGTQNAVIDSAVALQYNAIFEPVTHDATTVVGAEYHHAPAEGTA